MVVSGEVAAPASHLNAKDRRQQRHVDFITDAYHEGLEAKRRRGRDRDSGWQEKRRERERRLRLRCVALARWGSWNSWSSQRFCDTLGLAERTLLAWQALVGETSTPLGARPLMSTPAQRKAVREFLLLWSFACSFRDLESHFPEIPRCELGRLIWGFSATAKNDIRLSLQWTCPGTVWAIDYSKADHLIDGIYPFLLVVRDLASGYQIASLPCLSADSNTAVDLLRSLFGQFPVPLVLKSDNGSHFVNHRIRELLERHRVTLLLSPPYYPPFNGSCEAGIGAMKTRLHHLACRDGDPCVWTSNQVETARRLANASDSTSRGATPNELWCSAQHPIANSFRDGFVAAVARCIKQYQKTSRQLPLDKQLPDHTMIRRGISDALVGSGYLVYRSRSVPQPLLSHNAV